MIVLLIKDDRRTRNNARAKQWRLDNPEKFKAWFKDNHDKVVASRARNLEGQLARTKKWREENKEHISEYDKKKRREHPEEIAERAAAYYPGYYARTKQEHIERAMLRRALQLNAPVADFTNADWEFMKYIFHYSCAYCGKRLPKNLTRDHVQPLSRGGSHTIANIVPACKRCNLKKHAGSVPCQVQLMLPLKMASERRSPIK